MKIPALNSLYALAVVVIVWSGCSSGKSAYEQGNYYEAVITSVNRLRRNTDNKKSSETLRSSYPLAIRYYEDRANNAAAGSAPFKYKEVVQHYTTLQSMYDEIQRSPGALKVVPNPINYQSKLEDAKRKAAEESYNAAILALGAGDRANAKKAYYLFIDCQNYSNGYRDVANQIEIARNAATVKVAVDPIPVNARNYSINAQYFDNKLNEFLQANNKNEFVKFYRLADAQNQKIAPDHIVQLSFDEFAIGQVYMNEKESVVERDSVVVAYTYTDTKGSLLRENVDPVKIVPPLTDKELNTKGSVNTKTTESKDVVVVVPTVGDQTKDVKTEEKKTEEKPADTTPKDSSTKPEDKKEEGTKPEDKKEEGAKPDENKSGDKQPENTDKKPEDKPNQQNDDKGQSGNEEQVTICHQPPGKPSERKTMKVPKSAVNAHIAHGDYMGDCKAEEKKDDKGKAKGKDGGGMAYLFDQSSTRLIASNSDNWFSYIADANTDQMDTTKVYGKVKATVRHFRKTITSRGVLNFRIVDAKTKAVISEERMPSESAWVSEWIIYNGDSRALSEEQKRLAQQRELPQPTNQDLFAEFTKPLFDQITTKLTAFYKNY